MIKRTENFRGGGSVVRGGGSQIRGGGAEIPLGSPPQFKPLGVVQWLTSCIRST